MNDPYIIKKPWITEKSTALTSINQYVFMVKSGASKPEIKKAIHLLYKVDPIAVNVVNRAPKSKRFGGNRKGVQPDYRKAIVTIKDGQKIDLN